MLERMDGKLGENHSGKLHRETPEQKANRMVSEELSRRGWTESDLAARRRSDPDKLAIAVRLRNETTLPFEWIAARVQIGTAKGAKSVLHRSVRGQHQHKPARADEPCAQLEFQSTVL
jgi:ribosomal protein S13